VRAAAPEAEFGIDHMRVHPELVHTEGASTIDQVSDIPSVVTCEVGFRDKRTACPAEACDRHLVVLVRHV
jgi:hypothetical protein